jgi:hypothetical protein
VTIHENLRDMGRSPYDDRYAVDRQRYYHQLESLGYDTHQFLRPPPPPMYAIIPTHTNFEEHTTPQQLTHSGTPNNLPVWVVIQVVRFFSELELLRNDPVVVHLVVLADTSVVVRSEERTPTKSSRASLVRGSDLYFKGEVKETYTS